MEEMKKMDLNPSQRSFREDQLKEFSKNLDKLKVKLSNVEKEDIELGLPNIPMRKNSHTKTKDGYVYNKTNIKVQDAVKADLTVKLLHERVQTMWNSLPDDVRDLVNTLLIKKSTSRGGKRQGGRWNPDTKTIYMNIHARDSDVEHSFYHEVGHAKWSKMRETNPEKIKKFIDKQVEIGEAPTDYSQSYLMIQEKNSDSEERFRDNMKRKGLPIPEKDIKILEKNRKMVKDLFQNEIHSELNAYAMGSLDPRLIKARKDRMEKMLNAYKELWDLE